MRRTLDELLADARRKIERLEPSEAWTAVERDGALIVDIRAERDRERGVVPGSVHVPRTVLEWRADPASPWRNPHLGELDRRIILLCDHGCSSSLAAASLTELGFTRVGDVIGGFAAWTEAGLPTCAATAHRGDDELAGMGSPEPS